MLDLLAGIQLARRASERQFASDTDIPRRPRRTRGRSQLRGVLFLRRSRRVGHEHHPPTAVRRADAS